MRNNRKNKLPSFYVRSYMCCFKIPKFRNILFIIGKVLQRIFVRENHQIGEKLASDIEGVNTPLRARNRQFCENLLASLRKICATRLLSKYVSIDKMTSIKLFEPPPFIYLADASFLSKSARYTSTSLSIKYSPRPSTPINRILSNKLR